MFKSFDIHVYVLCTLFQEAVYVQIVVVFYGYFVWKIYSGDIINSIKMYFPGWQFSV